MRDENLTPVGVAGPIRQRCLLTMRSWRYVLMIVVLLPWAPLLALAAGAMDLSRALYWAGNMALSLWCPVILMLIIGWVHDVRLLAAVADQLCQDSLRQQREMRGRLQSQDQQVLSILGAMGTQATRLRDIVATIRVNGLARAERTSTANADAMEDAARSAAQIEAAAIEAQRAIDRMMRPGANEVGGDGRG